MSTRIPYPTSRTKIHIKIWHPAGIPQVHGSETLSYNETQDAYLLNSPSSPDSFWILHANIMIDKIFYCCEKQQTIWQYNKINIQKKKEKHERIERTHILRICPLKENYPAPAVTSSKMVSGFIKFNCWNNINCRMNDK